MKYEIIGKPKIGSTIATEATIQITKSCIQFHKGFVEKYGIKKYILFARNDKGCFCFMLSDDFTPESYVITTNSSGAYFIRIPKTIIVLNPKLGKYNVEKCDEWFVTSCKLGCKQIR